MTFNKPRLISGSILVVVVSLLAFASACGGGAKSGNSSSIGGGSSLPPSTTALTAAPNSVTLGGTTTLTARVSSTTAGTITGTVTFKVGSTTLGTSVAVAGGVATSNVTVSTANGFSVGLDSITANYSGDANFGSSSESTTLTVSALPATTTALTATPNSVTLGETTQLSASVSSTTAGTITGSVTFKVGSKTLGTIPISGGTATLSNETVSIANGFNSGSNPITANYSGDSTFGVSSGNIALKVIGVISTACAGSAPNCAPLTVNGGPLGVYVNAAFTDVTVCVPGMTGLSNCATVSNVLVDTGSVGLRLMKSLVPIALTPSIATGGGALTECYPFVASYMWGPVATADIHISGETATSAPIMLIDDTATAFTVPITCSSYGGLPLLPQNSVSEFGANGILGIGSTQQDCGTNCAKSVSLQVDAANEFVGLYYNCANSSCSPVAATVNSQVPQPVSQFATDNNGTAIDLQTVPPTGSATVTGALYFGIGTQFSNPMPSAATVLKLDVNSDITTKYNSTTNTRSYIDSGSNGYFFADSSIKECDINTAGSGWFCPVGAFASSAINSGVAGSSGTSTVPFSLESATTLFTNNNGADNAFNNLGALGGAGTFDWGLPFFFGRVVFNAIEQKSVTNSGGTTFTGPFVAY